MGENSKIQWTDHTFNPWRGCSKVSAGCANCYAETMARLNPDALGVWGDGGTRVIAGEAMWRKPVRWDRMASATFISTGQKARVFCASLADVFEDRRELIEPRARLWNLILETPNLVWLLLTKRPQNAERLIPGPWHRNAWLGVSVEDQVAAASRIPVALEAKRNMDIPGLFLSCEPLLGLVDLGAWPCGIDWVICGGESGPGARPMDPEWARSLLGQCRDFGVPFFMKQMGGGRDKRGDLDDLPMDLRVREVPGW